MRNKRQRLIDWIEKYFIPILFICLLLTLATALESQAQDKVVIDKWRLEKACKELILLDSLLKDVSDKDSLMADYRGLIATLKSDLATMANIAKERSIQLKSTEADRETYKKENVLWQNLYAKERWKKFSVNAGISTAYDLFNKRMVFGPSIGVGYNIYKF